jgi:hypothetical protein
MSLDKVREAKERGWRVILQSNEADEDKSFYFLVAPGGMPVEVMDKEGYGSTWGDFTEPEAWDRLPDTL